MLRIKKNILLLFCFASLSFSATSFATENLLPNHSKQTLAEIYQTVKTIHTGKNADYIPELAKVNSDLFGIAIVTVDGKVELIGDANVPFAIESISKPFTYALALQDNGEKIITNKVGLNATGHAFNSIEAIEEKKLDHLQNPLVNAGAIQVTSLIKGKNGADKWQRVIDFMSQLSASKLTLGESVYQSEMATNQHNRAIAELLNSYGMMNDDPMDAVDRYTKACSLMVTAKQLAIMGATLANKGVNPITHKQVVSPHYVRDVLSEMSVNGLYENSGTWWWTVGIPAKSGVGGGIMAVVPNKMAIVVLSPPLDEAGNSVRAQAAIKQFSERWKLHLLES